MKWLKQLLRPEGFFLSRGLTTGRTRLSFRCARCSIVVWEAGRGVAHCAGFSKPPVTTLFMRKQKRPPERTISIAPVGLWSVDANE